MKKSRRTYNGVHLNKKSNTQDVVEQSLTIKIDIIIGIRWNIAYSEWDDYRKQNGQGECIGNPQSRGIPSWFVLPDDMMFSEKFSGAVQRLDELRKGK